MIAGYWCVRKTELGKSHGLAAHRARSGVADSSHHGEPLSCASLPMAFISYLGTYLERNPRLPRSDVCVPRTKCSTETITTKKMGTHRYDGYCIGRRIGRISI